MGFEIYHKPILDFTKLIKMKITKLEQASA